MDRLWDSFIDIDNLWDAWNAVRRKGSGPGVDGQTVAEFERCAPSHLTALRRELSGGRYTPAPLKGIYIPKARGGWRTVGIPVVRDRVAQRACLNILLPLLDPQLEACTYAYRPGRSIQDAIEQIERWHARGHDYLLDADIENCFDTIDRELLLATVQRYVPDGRLRELIRRWLEAGTQWPGAAENPPLVAPCGIPQGSVLSPLLCNLFLDAFDETLLRQRFKLVRYADDFVVMATRPERAAEAMVAARSALAAVGLRLHPAKSRVTSFDAGFRYLGTEFIGDLILPTVPDARAGRGAPPHFIAAYPAAPPPSPDDEPAPPPPVAHGLEAVTSVLARSNSKRPLSVITAAFKQAVRVQRHGVRRRIQQESVLSAEKNYLV